MKKIVLLSGAALLALSTSAQAMHWNMAEYNPYIGADYVYSHAHHRGVAKGLKNDYNSAKFDLGMQFYKNFYTEFSYQMSGKLKNKSAFEGRTVKSNIQAYAMDVYGKYPIMCSNLGALLTAGAAIYNLKYKGLPSKSINRVGYRGGVGLQYDFNNHWAARVVGRYSYLGAKRVEDLKEVTVGMIYNF